MALEQRLTAFATAVGDDVQDLRLRIGSLASLDTTAKNNVVAAINELLDLIEGISTGGGASINDGTTSTGSVWSSSKTSSEISAAISALIDGAPTALDTLKEIADELSEQDSAVSGLITAVGNRIRFDAAQTLTGPQQLQACENIGVGDPEVDLVAAYEAARDA